MTLWCYTCWAPRRSVDLIRIRNTKSVDETVNRPYNRMVPAQHDDVMTWKTPFPPCWPFVRWIIIMYVAHPIFTRSLWVGVAWRDSKPMTGPRVSYQKNTDRLGMHALLMWNKLVNFIIWSFLSTVNSVKFTRVYLSSWKQHFITRWLYLFLMSCLTCCTLGRDKNVQVSLHKIITVTENQQFQL